MISMETRSLFLLEGSQELHSPTRCKSLLNIDDFALFVLVILVIPQLAMERALEKSSKQHGRIPWSC